VGWFGAIAEAVRTAYDLAAPVFVAELSLTALLALPAVAPRFQPLPRFPAVQRDLAVVVGAGVTAAEIEAAIRGAAPAWLTRVALFDVYQGNQVGPGRRSLAWSLTYQASDRTLTDAEVNEVHARIVAEITKRFDAEVRGA
jgi:phenylalanyl-tRNA synthetase beta chain